MLPQSILDKILAKYGKERIYSSDCLPLAQEIGVSETTVKRMFGLVGIIPESAIYRQPVMFELQPYLEFLAKCRHIKRIGAVVRLKPLYCHAKSHKPHTIDSTRLALPTDVFVRESV